MSENLFTRIPLNRWIQVQLVQLFHGRSTDDLVADWNGVVVFHIHAARRQQEGNRGRRINGTRTIGSFCRTQLGYPIGDPCETCRNPRLTHLLKALTVMEFPKEILPVTIRRAFVAPRGKQGFKLFDRRLHALDG